MKWIERCLCSVMMSTEKADILVIDNCSTDGTPEWIAGNFSEDRVKLIRNASNMGFGQANNIGLRMALKGTYSYVYLLNQDAWVKRDTLEILTRTAEASTAAGEHFGILSPMQMAAGSDMPDAKFLKWYRISGAITRTGIKEMEFVMAAHWLISRECLEDTGGFSPAFSHYGEDDNYIQRARFHGWKTGVVNEAEAVHDRSQRAESKDKRIQLKCTAQIVKISDPGNCLPFRLVFQPLELIGISVFRASLKPLAFIPKLIGMYPELIMLRKESKEKSAFL